MTEHGVSPVPREARPYQGRRAGVVTRLVAAVIDGVVVASLLAIGYGVLAGALFIVDPRNFSFPDVGLFFSLAAAFAVLVVYLTIAWWASGRSYGCLVMGLRVVGFRGVNMQLIPAFLRALFCAAFPIGLLWAAVSHENRSLQDTVMRTSVIYDWHRTAPAGRTAPGVREEQP